jgi:hypothetical protein
MIRCPRLTSPPAADQSAAGDPPAPANAERTGEVRHAFGSYFA